MYAWHWPGTRRGLLTHKHNNHVTIYWITFCKQLGQSRARPRLDCQVRIQFGVFSRSHFTPMALSLVPFKELIIFRDTQKNRHFSSSTGGPNQAFRCLGCVCLLTRLIGWYYCQLFILISYKPWRMCDQEHKDGADEDNCQVTISLLLGNPSLKGCLHSSNCDNQLFIKSFQLIM